MRAGCCSRASCTPSSPVPASIVRYPLTCSVSRTSFRFLGLSSTIRISSFATAHRDRKREPRSLTDMTLDPDLAAMKLDELPRQCETEPRALDFLVGRPDLPKLLEHRLLILRRDADSGVAYRDLNGPVHRFRPDLNAAALGRELDRVRKQVQEHLANLSLVSLDLTDPLVDRG